MQTIFTATTAPQDHPTRGRSRFAQDFYVNLPGQRAEKLAAAYRIAGPDGEVRESRRERLNDYVGAPIWSEREYVATNPSA